MCRIAAAARRPVLARVGIACVRGQAPPLTNIAAAGKLKAYARSNTTHPLQAAGHACRSGEENARHLCALLVFYQTCMIVEHFKPPLPNPLPDQGGREFRSVFLPVLREGQVLPGPCTDRSPAFPRLRGRAASLSEPDGGHGLIAPDKYAYRCTCLHPPSVHKHRL